MTIILPVLRMIRMVVEAGHAEHKRVCICGELAADTALTEEFLKMGVDCLSVVPACSFLSEKHSDRLICQRMKRMKSKVVLLPCGEYDEEKIYSLLKQGLDLLGGVEALIPKEAKILLKPNLLKKAEVEKAVITHRLSWELLHES